MMKSEIRSRKKSMTGVRRIVEIFKEQLNKSIEEGSIDKRDIELLLGLRHSTHSLNSHFAESVNDFCDRENKYDKEEVNSNYGYPLTYNRPRPIMEQIEELHKHFPELSLKKSQKFVKEVLSTIELPNGAEGWFAIPRWQKIAETYDEAFRRVSEIIGVYCLQGKMMGDWHELIYTVSNILQLGKNQPGDILIIPAQFGMRYRGISVRGAYLKALNCYGPNENEFGLGAFAVASMLLTNPDRLASSNDLSILCSGDTEIEWKYWGISNDHRTTHLYRSCSEQQEIVSSRVKLSYFDEKAGVVSAFLF